MPNALHRPIAVVGMACCLPGADQLEDFWNLLIEGRSAIGPIPERRLNRELYFNPERGTLGKTYSEIGGVISEKAFDPTLFSSQELAKHDPSHLMFCQVASKAWSALSHRPTNVGVYVGESAGSELGGDCDLNSLSDHVFKSLENCSQFQGLPSETQADALALAAHRLRQDRPGRNDDGSPFTAASWVARLTAQKLGLSGPTVTIDAACASSLVALATAAAALQVGSIDAAIVGGSSHSKSDSLVLFSRAQSCSATGSRPFDEEADGLISSEGYVALVVKTLERAQQDGDKVLAVLRGIGFSSDGRGRSLWAPRKEGQVTAIRRAYGPAVSPSSIQYIEAHATSTRVGDATELESLSEFFSPHHKQTKVLIGSVKSNIGHTLETAGLAALLKVILAIQKRQIPPTLNVRTPNRQFDHPSTPLRLAEQAVPWPEPEEGLPRRAAVSAFGIGGLNVHLVVEEPGSAKASQTEPIEQDAVAVVGMGVVLPGASSCGELSRLLASQQSQLREPPPNGWHPDDATAGGFLQGYEFDWLRFRLPPKQVQRTNPLQLALLDAGHQALGAGVSSAQGEREVTVVVGSPFGGDFARQLLLGLRLPLFDQILAQVLTELGVEEEKSWDIRREYKDEMLQRHPALLDETGSFTCSTLASRLTKTFNLTGGALALDAGENSSAAGLDAACNLLRTGSSVEVLCAAAQSDMDAVSFQNLARLKRLEPPPGEGVAVVRLKLLSRAKQDGDEILGVLSAVTCGHRETDQLVQRRPQPLSPSRTENCNVFARWYSQPAEPGDDPTSANLLERVMGTLRGTHLLLSLIHKTLAPDRGPTALRSCSHHGLFYEVIVEPTPAPEPVSRIFRFAGADAASLKVQLEATRPEELWSTAPEGFRVEDPCRVAIVARDQDQLTKRLKLASSQLFVEQSRPLLAKQGVFQRPGSLDRPRVAFIFPGQGSQYQGMLLRLLENSSAARQTADRANSVLQEFGLPTIEQMSSSQGDALHQDPVTTQVALLVADLVILAALRERGVRPDCVCGHSFGEIPAMVAAGVWTLEQAVRFTQLRARTIAEAGHEGGLLSLQTTPEELEALLERHGLDLYLTHYNAPNQTVVGGLLSEIERLETLVKGERLSARRLKVPGPLHTPLLNAVGLPLAGELEQQTLLPPSTLFLSNVTADYVVRAEEFRQNLVAQLTQPVRYQRMLERLVADGVKVLVEVGPGRVLTGLHRQTLEKNDVTILATDRPRGCQLEEITNVQAALECLGLLDTTQVSYPNSMAPLKKLWPIEEFDATAARRRANRAASQSPTVPLQQETLRVSSQSQELQQFLIDCVVELTGYPANVIDPDWELEADLGLDSIKMTQLIGEVREAFALELDDTAPLAELRTLRQIVEWLSSRHPTESPEAPEVSGEMERFLIDYVVELTGYPANVIDLDWDLEADLGIDSIKLSGLFGELREHYALGEAQGEVNLADFRTLRQILQALEGAQPPTPAAQPPTSHNGRLTEPSESPPTITSRYLLKMVPSPHREGSPTQPTLQGACLVVGSNPLGESLRAKLEELGATVFQLEPQPSIEETVALFEKVWERQPIPHLFLTTPRDADAPTSLNRSHWKDRRARGLMGVYWLCQSWYKKVRSIEGMWERATLVATTSLGGSFGIEGKIFSAEGGALAGLLKALVIETWVSGNRSVPVKIVDAPLDEPEEGLANSILRELAVRSYDMEIGYKAGRRSVLRAFPSPLQETGIRLKPEGVWIATGGGRGITAEAVRELGVRFGIRFHLLARSVRLKLDDQWRAMWPENTRRLKLQVMARARAEGKASPVDEWLKVEKALELEATLESLKSAGVQACYHCCDVSDRVALAGVLARIREQDGPIKGVLHGAGYSRDTKFENKDPRRVEQCIGAKIDGALALMEGTLQDPLSHFVTFGSISGRFGANGHTDYSLSNDMLAKLVDWYRHQRPEVAAVNFHWHAWGDVGMATRADTQLGLEKIGMQFMPAREGLEHLVAEIEVGGDKGEVLVTDDRYYRLFFHSETMEPGPGTGGLSLLAESELSASGDESVFSLTLDPTRDPFLVEHRLDDRPILPLVVALEAMAEAAETLLPDASSIRFSDIKAHQAMKFFTDAPQTVRVVARLSGPNRVDCEVRSDFKARDGTLVEPDRLHFTSRIQSSESTVEPSRTPGPPPEGCWETVEYLPRSSKWYHGPPLQNLRRMLLSEGEIWGEITAPALVHLAGPQRSRESWRVPAAAIDACLYAAGRFAWDRLGPSAPAALASLELGRLPQPGEACLVRLELHQLDEEYVELNFRLYGDDGAGLVRATEYRLNSLLELQGVKR